MFSFGFVQQLTGNMRYSVLALIVFFIAGFTSLFLTLRQEKQASILIK
jgi:UMF1 family MFS transporter